MDFRRRRSAFWTLKLGRRSTLWTSACGFLGLSLEVQISWHAQNLTLKCRFRGRFNDRHPTLASTITWAARRCINRPAIDSNLIRDPTRASTYGQPKFLSENSTSSCLATGAHQARTNQTAALAERYRPGPGRLEYWTTTCLGPRPGRPRRH